MNIVLSKKMITDNYFKYLLDQLIAKNYPFAIWTMPGEIMPAILIGNEKDVLSFQDVTQINNKEGFVFAPFRIQERSPILMIRPGILLQSEEDFSLFNVDNLPQLPEKKNSNKEQYFISKKEYLKDIKKTVEFLPKSSLSKVIISRLISKKRGNKSIGNIYCDLKGKSPKAFVYLAYFSKSVIWMGATPEILFNTDGKTVETVSLAGTQSYRKDGDYSWRTKEIEEQAFVSRYMLDVFYHFNIYPYTTRGPETLESGNVAHLKTNFYFTSDKIKGKWGDFVKQLHPTPAVCGLPKQDADKYISMIEKHDRRYYSGYVGLWQPSKSVKLFVNLRCMEITPEKYIIYSGGGITERSVPEKEWDETTAKAQPLLSVINEEKK